MTDQPKPHALPSLDGVFRLTPFIKANPRVKVRPDNFTEYAPLGTGFYGYQPQPFVDPIALAPKHEPVGGVVYFEGRISHDDFLALTKAIMHPHFLPEPNKRYVAYQLEAKDPGRVRFLRQMRLVSFMALASHFGAAEWDDLQTLPEQEIDEVEALWRFVQDEVEYWSRPDSPDFEGWFGGDGDLESELLSFGLVVENSYFGIYRIWSRCWLITK